MAKLVIEQLLSFFYFRSITCW